MRMRNLLQVFSWDMQKLTGYYPTIAEDYVVNCGLSQLIDYFQSWQEANYEVAVDIETHGSEDDEHKAALNPWGDTFDIIGISFTPYAGMSLHLNGRYLVQAWDVIKSFLETHKYFIYQNNLFDRCALMVNKSIKSNISWDTLDGIHLIHSGMPKKLDFQRSLYTNMEPYKEVYKLNGKYRPGNLDSDALARLNCLDTDATWRIALEQKKYLDLNQMNSILEEDTIALDMRVRGILVDQNRVAAHYCSLLPKIESLAAKYQQEYQISLSSPAQLNRLLYDVLRLPRYDDTGKSTTSKGSTNEKAIQAIANACGLIYLNDEEGERFEGEHSQKEILADILMFRGWAKIISVYCEGVFRNMDRNGVLHPQWIPSGSDTGRWSCQGTPMQGYPKDMRDTIIARPGKIFHGADYKGMQILAAAILAGDYELATKMLDPDYSLHNEVLEEIKPHYPSIKKIQAKTVVFGTFFGRTPRSIAQAFKVPQRTAELWQDIFYNARPKLKLLFEDKLPNLWKTKGYAEGIYGRRKYCDMVTEAKNHPVQNFESEIVKAALKKLVAEGFTPVLQIHDQLVCEEDDLGPEGNEARYQQFVSIMEGIKPELFHRFPVEGGYDYKWSGV